MDYTEAQQGTVERAEDIGTTPRATVKRWLIELRIADKTEKDWRGEGGRVLARYRGESRKRNQFNILWSNTETLRPALYNSLPQPDVRRRFRDKDPLGKLASEIMDRCIQYAIDTTAFDTVIRAAILDMLLPGRGVTRVRYVPAWTQGDDEDTQAIAWEQADVEQVQWDDFRRGPGKSWDEVRWVGFRHRMTRDDLVRLNPEVGDLVELDVSDDDNVRGADEAVNDMFATAEVWEIWDKDSRQVYFICESYKDGPVKQEEDPLRLLNFFPCPMPLQAVEDSSSLIPVTLYSLYEDQAKEMDELTSRINRIVKGLKLRGVYDSNIAELSQVMRGEDNDLIPAENVSALLDRGGLEKAIWMMPIETAAKVLQTLYQQREVVKQTIYEITGISDILRGSTRASETATAQEIKNKWGTLRIQRMQTEVQRYIRDLFRLMAEIIAERFSPETLAAQSLMPPEAVQMALPVLQSDMMREFHVDVETDSTIAASQEADMAAMRDVLTAVVQFISGIGPAVQAKAFPVEAAKEIVLAIVRRAKLGNSVEDALDGIQEPQTPQGITPEQIEQAKQAYEQQIQQLQAQMQQMAKALQQALQEKQAAEEQAKAAQDATQVKVYEVDKRAEVEAIKAAQETDRAALDAQVKIMLANIGNQQQPETPEENQEPDVLATALQSLQAAVEQMSRPKQVIRDETGAIVGVQTV